MSLVIQISEDASVSELHVLRELRRSSSPQMENCALVSSQFHVYVPCILLDPGEIVWNLSHPDKTNGWSDASDCLVVHTYIHRSALRQWRAAAVRCRTKGDLGNHPEKLPF